MKTQKAVILLSGGLDSTTVFAVAKHKQYQCYCISFDYGQRHYHELELAKKIAENMGAVNHLFVEVNFRNWGGSALTEKIDVPKNRDQKHQETEIPLTYVPARNTVFLSLALSWAETLEAYSIFIGVNALDYSGYPDCRPAFIEAFEKVSNLGTKIATEGDKKFRICAPLINLTKAEIIKLGRSLGVDYSLTSSCYDPSPKGKPCLECDACILREKGFQEAGLVDPLHKKWNI